MTYQIVVKAGGQKRTEQVEGVKALNTHLALFRSQGWKIADISRVVQ